MIVWFTGLPSSGKSTLARAVKARLGRPCLLLDGDELRAALVPPPGYGEAARDAFYRTLANFAALCARQGLPVLVAATAHLRRFRAGAIEVYVATPADECRRRDPKGLWAAESPDFPGPRLYEPPVDPAVTASGGHDVAACDRIIELIRRRQS